MKGAFVLQVGMIPKFQTALHEATLSLKMLDPNIVGEDRASVKAELAEFQIMYSGYMQPPSSS